MDCLKVPKSKGEQIRKDLMDKDLLFQEGKIESNDDYIFIPLKVSESPIFEELGFEIVDRDIDKREDTERDFKNLIDVPSELERFIPSSYDIIGDIALVKIPEEVEDYKYQIGEAILQVHKNLKTVLEDMGVYGEYRTRSVQYLAGEKKTETLYREHGAELEVDVGEVYFSPRLATERWRIVKKVQDGESVLDMFAGVGPYTVLIGRNVDVDHIHSIDLNPKAIYYLRRNVERNDIDDFVTIYEGDSREIAPDLSTDRIIMNLPHSSINFLKPALSALDGSGTIHYYEIIEEKEMEDNFKTVLNKIEKTGYSPKILEKRAVRTYSASKVHMAYDILVREK